MLRSAVLLTFAASIAVCVAATPSPSFDETAPYVIEPDVPSTLDTVDRFFFSKTCTTQKNTDTGVEEECCSGNFSCSKAVCKGKKVCNGFLGKFFWCSARECRPKPGAKPSDDQPSEDDLQESGEPLEEPGEGGDGDPNTGDEDGGGRNNGSPATPSATPSTTLTPSSTPSTTATPSTTPSATPSATLSSPSPSPTAAPPQWSPLNCDGPRRQRREIRDLAPWERRRFERAVLQLKRTPAAPIPGETRALSVWDTMVKLHMENGDEAHGGCYFLPWHRLFLLRVENLLRTVEPGLSLPYWDWTRDSQDAALSDVWGAEYLGGARAPHQPIQSGAFAWMEAVVPEWHRVARDFDAGVPGAMPALWDWGALDGLLRRASYADFADGLESAHILPHVAVGGDMVSTHSAPNDPVFFLHHAYIDFVYAIRQQRHWRYAFGGSHDFAWGTEQCWPGRTLSAFGVPASAAFDVNCVDYIAPSTQGTNAVSGRSAQAGGRSVAAIDCSDQAVLDRIRMSKARCENGLNKINGK